MQDKIFPPISPTLVIGLGGTGGMTISKVKYIIEKDLGSLPIVKYLAFDTDTTREESVETQGRHDYTKAPLDPTEFHYLGNLNVGDIIENLDQQKSISKWFPNTELRIGRIDNGARQTRCIGRVALHWNIEGVASTLRGALNQIKLAENIEKTRRLGYEASESPTPHIYIITSLCGGTGSGMFIDIAYLIRWLLQQEGSDARICGIFVLSSAFPSLNAQPLQANEYAALKEIDYLMEKEHYECTYRNGQTVTVNRPPFDIVYLIGAENECKERLADVEAVTSMIAKQVAVSITSVIGRAERGAFQDVVAIKGKSRGKITVYSSFGIDSISYPAKEAASICELRLNKEIISEVLLSNNFNDSTSDIQTLLAQLNIESDTLLSELFLDKDSRRITPVIDPNLFSKVKNKEMAQELDRFDQKYQSIRLSEYQKQMDEKADSRREDAIALIRAKAESIVNETGKGINYAKKYFTDVKKEFRKLLSSIEERQKSAQSKLDGIVGGRDASKKQLADATKGFFSGKRVAQSLRKCINLLQKEYSTILELHAIDLASNLYSHLIGEVEKLLSEIDGIFDKLNVLSDEFQRKIDAARRQAQISTKTLGGVLDTSLIDEEEIDGCYAKYVRDIRTEAAALIEQSPPLYEWRKFGSDTIRELLLNYTPGRFSEIGNRNIDELIKEREDAKILDRNYKKAAPYWPYCSESLPEEHKLERIEIIGIPSSNSPLVGDIHEQLKNLSYVQTGNPYKLTLIRMVHGLPIYARSDIRALKASYETMIKRGTRPLHIHKDYLYELPDLLPEENAQGKLDFAFGNALKIIYKEGIRYFCYTNQNDGKLMDAILLAEGRVKACEAFMKNEEAMKFVREYVEREEKGNGNSQMVENLREHLRTLNDILVGPGIDFDLRNQYKNEIRLIEEYIWQIEKG